MTLDRLPNEYRSRILLTAREFIESCQAANLDADVLVYGAAYDGVNHFKLSVDKIYSKLEEADNE